MDKQQTSVFSEYEAMDNCSVNSRQLEYWLKQLSSPGPSPKFGFEWTFMSNASSRYEPEEISFARNQTYQSIDHEKENKNGNANQQPSKQSKNKSYVNAMMALQKKVKTLEDQNNFMRRNLSQLNDQRKRSMSDSMAVEGELRAKLEILEPKTRKVDEIIEENKRLREAKDQKQRKLKLLQKKYQDQKASFEQQNKKYLQCSKQKITVEQEFEKMAKDLQKMKEQIKRLSQKNLQLQEMKQQSTLIILEKYNKSVELTEQYEKQNGRLKKQILALKKAHTEEIRNIEDRYNSEIHQCRIEFEKLKQNFDVRESTIAEKKRQAEYFREAYEKKDEQFMQLVKSQHKLQKYISDSRTVQIPQSLNPQAKFQREEVRSFGGLQSDNQIQFTEQEIPLPIPAETKSVGKPAKRKMRKSIGSSSQKQQNSRNLESKLTSKEKPKGPIEKEKMIQQFVEHEASKQSPEEEKSNKRRKQKENGQTKSMKSPQESKKNKKKEKSFEEPSYLVQSEQAPRTQPLHRITFEGQNAGVYYGQQQEDQQVTNSYLYSAQQPPHPFSSIRDTFYLNQPQLEINQFQQKNNYCHSVNEALFIELQNQLLEHYDQIQKLTLLSGNLNPAERAECEGRKKQLNEQLAAKNKRYCELKALL